MQTIFIQKVSSIIGGVFVMFFLIVLAIYVTHINALKTPSSHVLFVDHSTKKFLHTGSMTFPFRTVTAALEKRSSVSTHERMTIVIAEGIYKESVEIPKGTTLLGSSVVEIVGGSDEAESTVRLNDDTALVNLRVQNSTRDAIVIASTASVLISHVEAIKSDRYGIFMEKFYNKENPAPDFLSFSDETVQNMSHVKIYHSVISENGKQGLYLQDGRVSIQNSLVERNGEEGIDLHPNMYVEVSETTARANDESGLESEIGNNDVIIRDSVFEKNARSGVSFSTTALLGKIRLRRNVITGNAKFGMQCVRHKDEPREPRPFFPTVILNSKNMIEGNASDVAIDCAQY